MVERVRKKRRSPVALVKQAAARLEKEYGVPTPNTRRNALEELVQTILSQNTNDLNRDRAYTSLRTHFPQWEQVMDAPAGKIAAAIKVGGLANQKSVRIKKILNIIHQRYGKLDLDFLKKMPLQEAKELLGSFNGVGPKTVACVLLFACGKPIFPVDTHISRVATRLGLLPEKCSDVKAHEILNSLVPPEKAFSFHINVIRHGRQVCRPSKPKCSECALKGICPSSDKFGQQNRSQ
jgi:endonuclease-3